MVKIMEYKIISGSVIEIKRCRMSCGTGAVRRRAPRTAGKSSLKKIAQNEKSSIRRLARIINTNFDAGDLWITLKYSDDRLPSDKVAAKKCVAKFLRNVSRAYKKQTGTKLRYILCTSDNSSKNDAPARLHHHLAMDRAAYELICKYWPQDEVNYRVLDGRKDHTDLAQYILKNASKEANEKAWSTSRGLDKPIVTEPEPVDDFEIKNPKNSKVCEKHVYIDDITGYASAYMRAVMDVRPIVVGGKIRFPRKQLSDTDKARVTRGNIKGGTKNGI